MTTLVGVFKKSSRFSAKSHVDVLGTVIKITLAVDERSAFGPGTFGTLKVCSHLNARKAIQYDTNTYRCDRRGAASLRYRNRAEITVLMCK